MASTLHARRVLTGAADLGPTTVEVGGDGRVAALRPAGPGGAAEADVAVDVLAPGFVDLQVNGIGRFDVAVADGPDWDALDDLLAAQGVTSWCPTLVAAALDAAELDGALARIATAAQTRPGILGAHIEGPFLTVAGAHPPEALRDADPAWCEALSDIVRVVTLAPDRPGALDCIRALVGRGVVVSLGHSQADLAAAEAAVDAGARLVTHLFNAMGPLHHRAPGLAGAALTDPRLTVAVIADNVHVHPAALAIAAAACGDRLALVTDAVAVESRAIGRVALAEGPDSDAPRLADGTLAGSRLRMDEAVRNLMAAGASLPAAVHAASTAPARALGLDDRGVIRPGARADLVALTDDGRVTGMWVGGRPRWPRR